MDHEQNCNLALLHNNTEGNELNNHAPALPHEYLCAATSYNTRKAYQADIRHFIQSGGFLPTSTAAVLQYLQQNAKLLNSRTLVRRLTALKQWHLYQGFADPTSHPIVRKTMTGIKNVHGKPKDKAPPLSLDSLVAITNHLNSSSRLIDCRNCALLNIGFFGAFRRSELAAIQWEHINFLPEGIEITIPKSKTDQVGDGQVCAIPYGDSTICPISILTAWRDKSQSQTGAVFKHVTKGGCIKNLSIKPNQINIIIKNVAALCQLPNAERYSSHSMRRGLATEASKKGAPFSSIMQQGRWRHEGTVLGYIDEGKRFDQNVVDIMLQNTGNAE